MIETDISLAIFQVPMIESSFDAPWNILEDTGTITKQGPT
jgi:hypothetical protein